MKDRKEIITAVILSGSIGLGAQTLMAQAQKPGGGRPLENPTSEKQFEQKESPGGSQEQGTGRMGSQQGSTRMSDADIKSVKEALKAKGLNPGPINGTMDSQTQQAIRDFQKTNNLRVTGEVDEQTAAKLGVTIGQKDRTRQGSDSQGSDSAAPKKKGAVE
jgi:peptidoglycan hydrolase-like protein with peptidoglycan-binding domain